MFKFVLSGLLLSSSPAEGVFLSGLPHSSAFSTQDVLKPSVDELVDRAHQLLGTRYKTGGSSTQEGFDCSGLLVYLFKTQAGIVLPRTSLAMASSAAATVRRDELAPGDVVFFNRNGRGRVDHAGLYIGRGQFIHSPRPGKHIRIDSLENRYWTRSYSAAKRFH